MHLVHLILDFDKKECKAKGMNSYAHTSFK